MWSGKNTVVLSADLWPWRLEELLRAGVDAVLDKVQSPRQIAREVRREGEAAKSRSKVGYERGPASQLPQEALIDELRRKTLPRTPVNKGNSGDD